MHIFYEHFSTGFVSATFARISGVIMGVWAKQTERYPSRINIYKRRITLSKQISTILPLRL